MRAISDAEVLLDLAEEAGDEATAKEAEGHVALIRRSLVDIEFRRMLSGELDSGGGKRAAVAMLTTDTRPKERVYRVQLSEGRRVTLAGMAKGTRMLHPRLATLLCVLTTDLAIEQRLLQRALQQSVARSFGRLNIDGDSSPNDSVLLLANGAAEVPAVAESSRELAVFQEALDALCADLAQQDFRARVGQAAHGVVLGQPVAVVAQAVGGLRQLERGVDRLRRRVPADDGRVLSTCVRLSPMSPSGSVPMPLVRLNCTARETAQLWRIRAAFSRSSP